MLSDMYSKLPDDATQAEKDKFFPVSKIDPNTVDWEIGPCPAGQFMDWPVDRYCHSSFCYHLPTFPDYQHYKVYLAQTQSQELLPCLKTDECKRANEGYSVCHLKTGFTFKEHHLYAAKSGICVQSTGVIDVLSVMYASLTPDTQKQQKDKYVADPRKECYTECDKGYWCLDIDVTVVSGDRRCFPISNSLPTKYNEGPITIPHRFFKTCKTHSDCKCEEDYCKENLNKCYTATDLKLVHRDRNRKSELRNGFCILANPVASVFFHMYTQAVPTSDFYKYLPVDYGETKTNRGKKLGKCWQNSHCGDGQFCGALYNYEDGGLKTGGTFRHCFQVPTPPDSSQLVAIDPSESEMPMCSETLRCLPNKSWKCLINADWNFQLYTPPNYSTVSGLCVKVHPVTNIFIKQFESLASDVQFEEMKKYLPIGYKGLNGTTLLKECSKNEDCQMNDGQFCGAVYDYFDNLPKTQLSHCYAVPQFAPTSQSRFRNVQVPLNTTDLLLCDSDSDCENDEILKCDLETGWIFVGLKEGKRMEYNGVCIKDFCLTNKDCNSGRFCEHAFDVNNQLAYPNHLYCFSNPECDEKFRGSTKAVVEPDEVGLKLCEIPSDCNSEDSFCDLKTGQKYVTLKKGTNDIVVYNGVCMKGLRIGFVYSDTFWKLGNDVDVQQKQKYLAVDPLKTCSTNKDCNSGQFCEHVFDFTNQLANPNHLYCFSYPEVDEKFRITTKAVVQPDEVGLKLCEIPSDCNSEELFCNTNTGQKYVQMKKGTNDIVIYNGVCMKADICKVNEYNEPFKWSFGTSPTDAKINCDSDLECAGIRDNSNDVFQGYCIKSLAYHNTNLCCHRKVQKCEYGQIVGPAIRCGKTLAKNETLKMFAECNGDVEKVQKQETKSEKWCDLNGSQCCQSSNNLIQFCPDQQTPLFNEPKCLENGKCLQKIGSICKNGHCCPDVHLNSTTGKMLKNQYSYTTNYPCLAGHRPTQFQFNAYCEKETEKVVIFGHLSALNESLTRYLTDDGDAKKCQIDDDCSADNSTICIYDPEPYCYYNPKRHLPLKSSNILLITSLTIVGIAIVIMVSGAVIFFIWKKKKLVKIGNNLESETVKNSAKTDRVESKVSTTSISKMSTKPTSNVAV